jgi:hypothetical protein
LVYPRKDIWNGRSRKAPETPPMEVKKEMTNATRGGIHNATSIPAVWKNMEPPFINETDCKLSRKFTYWNVMYENLACGCIFSAHYIESIGKKRPKKRFLRNQ